MKICQKCGTQNNDDAKFCGSCGSDLQNVASTQPQQNINQSNTNPHQKPNFQAPAQKKRWVAALLDFIGGLILYCLSGIGHIVYLNLYKRGIILCAIGLFITVVFGIIAIFYESFPNAIGTIFGWALIIYSVYDARNCSDAINEGRQLPLLFGFIDSESLSKGMVIAIIAVCILAVFAFVGAVFMAVDIDLSAQVADNNTTAADANGAGVVADNNTNSADANADDNDTKSADATKNDDSGGSDSGVKIKVTYPGSWSASIGDSDTSNHYEKTGNYVFDIDEDEYDVIAAAVSKKTASSDKLKVEIIKDGVVVDQESTKADYGVVSVSATLD